MRKFGRIKPLFIIPLVLMSLVSSPSAVYAENIGMMQSLVELSSYTTWHPFFKTSLSVVIWTMIFMSFIWICYWFYLKRKTVEVIGSMIEIFLVIGSIYLFTNVLVPLLILIPAVLFGYFFNEFTGVMVGVITLVLYTLPVRKIELVERILPRFFLFDDEGIEIDQGRGIKADHDEGVEKQEPMPLPKYLQNIDPKLSEKDPLNYEIQEDSWYKSRFIQLISYLNSVHDMTHGIHINSIKSNFHYGDSPYTNTNEKIHFSIESFGIDGAMVINQIETQQDHLGKGNILPSEIYYRPGRDDPLTDEEIALRNPPLHRLKEGGFLDRGSIFPVREISADPSKFLFVKPTISINIYLLRDNFQELRRQLTTHNTLPKISYHLKLVEDWEENPEIAWKNRQTPLVGFYVKSIEIEFRRN